MEITTYLMSIINNNTKSNNNLEILMIDPDEEKLQKKKYVNTKNKTNKSLGDFLYKNQKKGIIHEYVGAGVFIVLISILIRILLIQSSLIPSESMVSTFIPDDRLIVVNFTYGIRIPILNMSLPGITKPERGDIIIFEHPEYVSPGVEWELLNLLTLGLTHIDNNSQRAKALVKRCMAIPGDTIIIDSNKDVYINGEKLKKELISEESKDSYSKLLIYEETNDKHSYIIQENKNNLNYSTSPTFYIPKKGDKLIIKKEETNEDSLETENHIIYINGLEIDDEIWHKYKSSLSKEVDIDLFQLNIDYYEHIIKYNYYFGMGDNRDNSRDSRAWGLIREDLIYGSPLFIYYPFDRFGAVH